MAAEAKGRFLDYLPAVLRRDDESADFLGRFLQAFEAVFAEIQEEIEAIPSLFALVPTPVLEAAAAPGTETLRLDSAAGLCPGDILRLESPPAAVEFVEVKSVPRDLTPTTLTVSRPLRFAHAARTPVRVVGPPGPAGTVRQSLSAGENVLAVAEAPTWGLAAGDILRIDRGALTEYAQVLTVSGAIVTFTPTLERPHEVGRPIVLLKPAPTTTPPLAFVHAVRTAPELVLRTAAFTGQAALELDTVIGLSVGDILHLREPNLGRVEFARVDALPPEPAPGGVLRSAIRLRQPLRFDHQTGVAVGVLGAPAGATTLPARAEAAASTLVIDDPEALGADVGGVLRIGDETAPEYVQIVAASDRTLTVTPPLQQAHEAAQPVVRMAPSGSGTAFLGWLSGWLALTLRADRGERWNRELLRLAGRIWPRRGTKAGVETLLNSYLKGEAEATIFDQSNPLQIGLVSTVGVDTVICGGPAYFFWVNLIADAHNTRLYNPAGLAEMVQMTHQILRAERPAHTYYDLRVEAHTMQIGVDSGREVGARVGETTLLWHEPLIIPGDR